MRTGLRLCVCTAILLFAEMPSGTLRVGAANPGTWVSTGSMNIARAVHTAALLPGGKVLVMGGFGGSYSAELFDPATGSWSATGNLNTDRLQDHTATVLASGRVLVAGGLGCMGGPCVPVTAAEIFRPGSGTWVNTGSLNTARCGHTATRLANGLVLAAGGLGGESTPLTMLSSAELYNPKTGIWTITGSMNYAREGHTATLLQNGMVLVAGGSLGSSFTAELYNPQTGTWTVTGGLNEGRARHTATRLGNGRVLVTGGSGTNSAILASCEIFDPATGAWTVTGAMKTGRYVHTATLLLNGVVLAAGGSAIFSPFPVTSLASAELYVPWQGVWVSTASMGTPRSQFTATRLKNGRVLAAGGWNENPAPSAEVFQIP